MPERPEIKVPKAIAKAQSIMCGCGDPGAVWEIIVPWKQYTQEFFAYETIGITPTRVAEQIELEYDGVKYRMSKDFYDKLVAEPDVDVRYMMLRDVLAIGTEAAPNALLPQRSSQPDQPAGVATCKIVGFDTTGD